MYPFQSAMWQGFLIVHLLSIKIQATFLASSSSCALGEYWCQERCGSDSYGDTCCQTPNGQHNLCGPGTSCCMNGCCLAGTICNSDGGCDPAIVGSVSTGASSGIASLQTSSALRVIFSSSISSCPGPSTVTSQTTVTQSFTTTNTVTQTSSALCATVPTILLSTNQVRSQTPSSSGNSQLSTIISLSETLSSISRSSLISSTSIISGSVAISGMLSSTGVLPTGQTTADSGTVQTSGTIPVSGTVPSSATTLASVSGSISSGSPGVSSSSISPTGSSSRISSSAATGTIVSSTTVTATTIFGVTNSQTTLQGTTVSGATIPGTIQSRSTISGTTTAPTTIGSAPSGTTISGSTHPGVTNSQTTLGGVTVNPTTVSRSTSSASAQSFSNNASVSKTVISGTVVTGTTNQQTTAPGMTISGTTIGGISTVATSNTPETILGTTVTGITNSQTTILGSTISPITISGPAASNGTHIVIPGTTNSQTTIPGTTVNPSSFSGSSAAGSSTQVIVPRTTNSKTSGISVGASSAQSVLPGSTISGTTNSQTTIPGSTINPTTISSSTIAASSALSILPGTTLSGTTNIQTTVPGTTINPTTVSSSSASALSAQSVLSGTTIVGTTKSVLPGTTISGTTNSQTTVAGTTINPTTVSESSASASSAQSVLSETTLAGSTGSQTTILGTTINPTTIGASSGASLSNSGSALPVTTISGVTNSQTTIVGTTRSSSAISGSSSGGGGSTLILTVISGTTLSGITNSVTTVPGTTVNPTTTGGLSTTVSAAAASATTSSDGLPVYANWPTAASVVAFTTHPGPSQTDSTSCNLWFFSVCLNGFIQGFDWDLPPGIYPTGPPPPSAIKFPTGFSLTGALPPFPQITVFPNSQPQYENEPENECQEQTATLCGVTTSFATSGSLTTATSTGSTCGSLTGCSVTGTTSVASVTSGSCATSTVADVWVSCVTASSSTSCAPVSSFTTAGCSVTASTTTVSCTATASASATAGSAKFRRQAPAQACSPVINDYIVWREVSNNTAQTAATQDALNKLASTQVNATTSDLYGVLWWTVPLSPADAPQLSNISGVLSWYQQCTSNCPNYFRSLRYFADDEEVAKIPELGFISEVPGYETSSEEDRYYFDQTAGENIPVYILDSGANLQHTSFTSVDNIASATRWIHIFEDVTDDDNKTPKDDSGIPAGGKGPGPPSNEGGSGAHGTKMLDMVTGARGGTSRRVQPILVRTPRRDPLGSSVFAADAVKGLDLILQDLQSGNGPPVPAGGGTRAILSISLGFGQGEIDEETGQLGSGDLDRAVGEWMNFYLRQIVNFNVLPVVAVGNDGHDQIQSAPDIFGLYQQTQYPGYNMPYIPEMLVVGFSDFGGNRDDRSNADPSAPGLPNIYAPTSLVYSAEGNVEAYMGPGTTYLKGYSPGFGASLATAKTAGLAAYFLALARAGQLKDNNGNTVKEASLTPQGLKQYIIDSGELFNQLSQQLKQQYPDDDYYMRPNNCIWNRANRQSEDPCPYLKGGLPPQRRRRLKHRQVVASSSAVASTSLTGNASMLTWSPATDLPCLTLSGTAASSISAPNSTTAAATTTTTTTISGGNPGSSSSLTSGSSGAGMTSAAQTSASLSVVALSTTQMLTTTTAIQAPTTTIPAALSTVPLTYRTGTCDTLPTNLPNIPSVNAGELGNMISTICSSWSTIELAPSSTLVSSQGFGQYSATFGVSWYSGCGTSQPTVNVGDPEPNIPLPTNFPDECVDIFSLLALPECPYNNVGGYEDIGCSHYWWEAN